MLIDDLHHPFLHNAAKVNPNNSFFFVIHNHNNRSKPTLAPAKFQK